MKRKLGCWNYMRTSFSKIHLVDRFLIVFMLMLLFQSAYGLLANHTSSGEAHNIDVIVRTSTAAIFGYFLSTNFIRHSSSGSTALKVGGSGSTLPAKTDGVQNRIGFTDPDAAPSYLDQQMGGADFTKTPEPDAPAASHLQIVIAAIIGLFCLTALILLRNISVLSADMTSSSSATATVAQFRDIVSGCIGFLIGCPTQTSNNSK